MRTATELSGTPVRKQIDRLTKSKNKWKDKYKQLKADIRRMENQVRAVEKSREQWKAKAKQAQQTLKKTTESNKR